MTNVGKYLSVFSRLPSASIGRSGYTFTDIRFVNVRTDNEGSYNHYLVTLYSTDGGTKIPVLCQIKSPAYFQKPSRLKRLKADEDTPASGPGGQGPWI